MKRTFSNKERLLTPKKVIAVNMKTGKPIWLTDKIYPQHFYPLSIIDYCKAIKNMIKNKSEELPILSVSSKDFPYCDFKCRDCLACLSRDWALKDNNIEFPIIPIGLYKKILREISLHSEKYGCRNVRFEICGEGNPDMYSNREEMIKFAAKECNMKIVYVSTGSQLKGNLIKTLVKYASCIRISFPGITNDAYKNFSRQNASEQFTYDDSIKLLKKLVYLRKKYNREDELLIGCRTCMHHLNTGAYDNFIKTIGDIGVDSFQAVQILTPEFDLHKEERITTSDIIELMKLKQKYKEYGLLSFQTPNDLSNLYFDRNLPKGFACSKCWSSKISPILYGTDLICCTLWDKIINKKYHYGTMTGEPFELEKLMYGENSKFIDQDCPKNCTNCCAYKDNLFMESLYKALAKEENLDDIDFIFEYC